MSRLKPACPVLDFQSINRFDVSTVRDRIDDGRSDDDALLTRNRAMVSWSGHLDFIDALKLAVLQKNGEGAPLNLSTEAQVFWREFTLNTRLYREFCATVMPGFVLDRIPSAGGNGATHAFTRLYRNTPDWKLILILSVLVLSLLGMIGAGINVFGAGAGRAVAFGCFMVLYLQFMVLCAQNSGAHPSLGASGERQATRPRRTVFSIMKTVPARPIRQCSLSEILSRPDIVEAFEGLNMRVASRLERRGIQVEIGELAHEFRRFFALLCTNAEAGGKPLGMKSLTLDLYWHEVVATTPLWRELCMTIAGTELDHVPGTAGSRLDDEHNYRRTYSLYLETFCCGRNGEKLPPEGIWPRPVSHLSFETPSSSRQAPGVPSATLPVCDDSANIPVEVLAIVNDTIMTDTSHSSCDHGSDCAHGCSTCSSCSSCSS
ncbi:hypothetical protein ACTVH1_16830 [Gluconobacter cerinus]